MLLLRTAGRRLATGLRLEPFAAVQCSLRPRTSTAAQTERFDLLSGTAAAASAVASAGGSDAGASAADGAAVDGPVTAADISHLPAETFEQLADVWIGGLWTRLERGLREAEGEAFEYDVKPERGSMHVLLPYDGHLIIKKEPQQHCVVIESNLFEPWEDQDAVEFRPVSEREWRSEDGEAAEAFVARALTQYLKVGVKL